MELRNGRSYTPDLNKHFRYSFKQNQRPKRSPRPKGHSLSHVSVDSYSASSAHSFNKQDSFEAEGGGGGCEDLLETDQEKIYDQQGFIEEEVYLERSPKDRGVRLEMKPKKTLVSLSSEDEFTEIKTFQKSVRTVTTSSREFVSKKENIAETHLNGHKLVKTSTPVEKQTRTRSKIDYTPINGFKKISAYEKQTISNKKQTISQNKTQKTSAYTASEQVFLNSLEDHIFHDTSYKKVASFENDHEDDKQKQIKSRTSQTFDDSFHYLYKLNGSCLNDYSDLSEDEEITWENDMQQNISVNHQRRSLFRQKRRDWYLNRRSFVAHIQSHNETSIFTLIASYILTLWKRLMHSTVLKKTIVILEILCSGLSMFSLLRNFTSYASKVLVFFYNFVFKASAVSTYECVKWFFAKTFSYLNNTLLLFSFADHQQLSQKVTAVCSFISIVVESFWSVVRKRSLILLSYMKETKDEIYLLLFGGTHCCVSIFLIIFTLPFLLLFLTLFSQVSRSIIPDPNTLSVSKSQTIFLGTSGNSIPAWHFLPPSAEILPPSKTFRNKSPVTLYLREGNNLSSDLQVNIFKTLVSLGYHVIVPVNVLNQEEVSIAWSWVKERASSSSAYLWGDHIDSSTLTGYAKDFCTQLIPPDGVIIETEIKNPQHSHRSLEIWSCNCTNVQRNTNEDGEGYHRYTHVKCPLSVLDVSLEDVYNHIVACIAAVNRGSE